MPPPASAPGRRPRDRRPVARTSLAVAAAASLVLLLSLSGAALAQDDAEELARIAAVTTVLDLSSPTPSFSGGRLALAGGRAAAVAEGAPSEGAGPVSAEEAEAAYDALQAQVEARLEQERLDAVRVLDLARQANRRTAGEGEGVAGAVGAGDGGGAPADAALADADAPSAEEVARAAAIAENPWRAHRCTTAQLSDGARDEMDAAVRAHLQEEEQQQQAGGGGARRRLRRLSRRRRSLLARPSAPVPSALAHRHDRAFRSHSHDHNRALRTAEDPFDVEFTPDPFAGVPASAVAAAADRARRNPTVVPTYLHVVTPSATAGAGRGAVADASLLAQLRVLNATYASAGFAFRLEAVTRVVSSSFATAEVGSGPERAMKTALRRGGRDSLNVYVTSPPALLGWSSFPESARSDRQYDGVVIGFYTLPGSTLKPYNQGMTMAHEIGHWLGLLHTFEGSQCGSLGDRVNDVSSSSFCRLSIVPGGGGGGGGFLFLV